MGANSGVFTFDSVSPGPTTVVVEAAEHLPVRVELDVARDTSFGVRMAVDSVALRMIGLQVKRLETRSRTMVMPTTSLNRDAIAREKQTNIGDLLAHRSYVDPIYFQQTPSASVDEQCAFLDDEKVSREVFGAINPELIERVEIYRDPGGRKPVRAGSRPPSMIPGIRMIRVYTKRYVSLLPRKPTLPKALYMTGVGRASCA